VTSKPGRYGADSAAATPSGADPLPGAVRALLPQLDTRLPAAVEAVVADDLSGLTLGPLDTELVRLGVASSAAALDPVATRRHLHRARDLGADASQLADVLVLVSVLGMHTLTSGIPLLAQMLDQHDDPALRDGLDERRRSSRRRNEGEDDYWKRFEAELPGFLDGLLRLAPEAYEMFFAFSALPWRSRALDPKLKELLYVAIDSTPTHVYAPGLRLHADNARRLGATPTDLAFVLLISAQAGGELP
jgi:alkylhydroperoxidase/carboxymuconolactone decarboxylase family protein YurZ